MYNDFINTGTYTDLGGVTILTGVGPNTVNNSGSLTILDFASTNNIIVNVHATVDGKLITGQLLTRVINAS